MSLPALFTLPEDHRLYRLGEFKLIAATYGKKRAARSRVPLINHITEGARILQAIAPKDWERPARGFCLHPLLQKNEDLAKNWSWVGTWGSSNTDCCSPILAMEYRACANNYLAHHRGVLPKTIVAPRLSYIEQVNQMLVADKVQNYKDFLRYHKATHPNSERLERYFQEWLEALGVSKKDFDRLARLIGGAPT